MHPHVQNLFLLFAFDHVFQVLVLLLWNKKLCCGKTKNSCTDIITQFILDCLSVFILLVLIQRFERVGRPLLPGFVQSLVLLPRWVFQMLAFCSFLNFIKERNLERTSIFLEGVLFHFVGEIHFLIFEKGVLKYLSTVFENYIEFDRLIQRQKLLFKFLKKFQWKLQEKWFFHHYYQFIDFFEMDWFFISNMMRRPNPIPKSHFCSYLEIIYWITQVFLSKFTKIIWRRENVIFLFPEKILYIFF